jgi:hypothetical protein
MNVKQNLCSLFLQKSYCLSGYVEKNNIVRDTTDKIQGDQKVSVHLMIIIQKVTSNVQSIPRQSPNIHLNLTAWQPVVRGKGH